MLHNDFSVQKTVMSKIHKGGIPFFPFSTFLDGVQQIYRFFLIPFSVFQLTSKYQQAKISRKNVWKQLNNQLLGTGKLRQTSPNRPSSQQACSN